MTSTSFIYSSFKVDDPVKFTHLGNRKKKGKRSLSHLLHRVEEEAETLQQLKKQGKVDKVLDKKWRMAIDRAEGKKVKDDPTLIRKTLKNVQKRKERNRKKWQERKETTERRQEKRQEKRVKNIKRRKQDKKAAQIKRRKRKS